MSTLWTPGGEHPVDRNKPEPDAEATPPAERIIPEDYPSFDDLSPEEQQQAREMASEMAEAQRQLAEAPVEVVLANHAMGIYELAAIHLSQQPPNLAAAKVAIDAFAALMDSVGSDFGDASATLQQARTQIQMAFVQLSQNAAADS